MLAMTAQSTLPAPRYLALGDSYSIGESVGAAGRWPNVLVRLLRAQQIPMEDANIFARTSWTVDELGEALDNAEAQQSVALTSDEIATAPKPPYALVTLLIGVNDQYRGAAVSDYQPRFAAMLARAIGYADGHPDRVVVLSIPDWGITPFARIHGRNSAQIAQEIDAYNAAAANECHRIGVAFVNITPLTREANDNPDLLAADGLHPSALDYARWAELALPAALQALATR